MKQFQLETQGFVLLLFSLLGFAISYATTLLLARALGPTGYNDYAVAIASATILATFAEMGTGKFAMRVMPAFYEQHQWSSARGYVGFSLALILAVSVLLGLIVAIGEGIEASEFGSHALGIVILFLPAMALLGFGVELSMSNNAILRAALVMRIVAPIITLITAAVWINSTYALTASRAAYCYACGTVVGLLIVWRLARHTTPREFFSTPATYEPKKWLFSALPFLYFGLLISMLAKIGIIILEIIHPDESVVAVYSVAIETGSFLYIVAKSTDKMFLPRMSLLIEHHDVDGMLRIRRRRRIVLGIICSAYLTIIYLFGKEILGFFGPKFTEGYPALCLITASTCIWTLFSLAPSFLKFNRKNTLVVSLTAATVVANILLCLLLGRRFGATGAAIAYALPVTLVYFAFAYFANQTLVELRTSTLDLTETLHNLDADEYSI